MNTEASVIALDVGTVRIGVSKAWWPDGLPTPYTTLANDDDFIPRLQDIIEKQKVKLMVVGLPRGLNGQETNQTVHVQSFITMMKYSISTPIYTQDEAVTSHNAESELKSRDKPYTKADIDSLSATYILEDFIKEHPKGAGLE